MVEFFSFKTKIKLLMIAATNDYCGKLLIILTTNQF